MVTEDQSTVVAFLESPAAHGGAAVERVDTHASIVFLSGDRALKLKRAVRYDYLDFSTADKRRAMCEAELRANARAAPAIYRDVIPVTREPDGSLALGGHGAAVDWVLHMARFDQAWLFDRLAERGQLPLAAMTRLAHTIARFHAVADRRLDQGGAEALRRVVEGNAAGFEQDGGGIVDLDACRQLTEASLNSIDRHAVGLDQRRAGGFVRQCHGDLHLRNIVLLHGVPTLFDAIEFNDDISCVDVLYDLAFLLMDLWHRRLRAHANTIWNGYTFESNDWEGLPLLPLFLSCRAAIRAKTSLTAATLTEGKGRSPLESAAREYLALAADLLRPAPPRLVAVGGLSGSGKSSVAHAVAPGVGPVPGAVVLRSDVIRKRLSGVESLARLDPAAYSEEMSRQVYAALAVRAAGVLRGGQSVVLDAVFLDERDRRMAEEVARAAAVPFVGVWLDAPADVLVSRVASRTNDPSDAGPDVVRAQLRRDPGPIGWTRVEAGRQPDAVAAAVGRLLTAPPGSA
jgi:aminoglycoside phosphotransferase family enzyme/predicted kinase